MRATIVSITKGAGAIIMRSFRKKLQVTKKDNDPHNYLTQADLAADDYIQKRLRAAYPRDKILTEESVHKIKDRRGRVWLVDPLDGTKDFVHGRTGFSVMIALCVDGVLTLGVVYAPVRKTLWYAERGKGAYVIRRGTRKRLHVSDVSSLRDALLVTRIMGGERRPLDALANTLPVRRRYPESSVGLKLSMIAEGDAELHVNTNYRASLWDTAAPQLILEEAGGTVTDFSGRPLNYLRRKLTWDNSFVASNGLLQKEALREVRKFLKRY